MELAIEQARAQLRRYGLEEGGERPDPKVGCVVVTKNGLVEAGYRGELERGEHAEFTVMEKKLPHEQLAGATVYTTLEPCTDRKPPKKSCADRLIERRVGRVVIGFLDPDDRGQGYHKLLDARIAVELFPQDLVDQIRELNRRFIESRKSAKATAVKISFPETASTSSRAFFGPGDEVLGQVGEPYDRITYTIPHGPAFYLRIIPTVAFSMPIAAGDLLSKLVNLGTFGVTFGGISRANGRGAVFFEPIGVGGQVGSLSQAFRNGELWGINIDILRQSSSKHPPLVRLRPIEQVFYNSLRSYAAFLPSIGLVEPPYTVEAGIVGIKDWTLAVFDPSYGVQYPGAIYQDEIVLRQVLSDLEVETIDKFLLEFFKRVHEQTGYPRPSNLFGFPGIGPYAG
jgi:pyrimidine deaminase RibD-like protein